MTVLLYFLILLTALFHLPVFGTETKPTACTERLKHVTGHTACLQPSPQLKSSGIRDEDKRVIVSEHNKYRNGVQPPSTNMLKLYWNNELSLIAQAWASNCRVHHDPSAKRDIPGVYQIGQNIAWDFHTWPDVIKAWYDEVKDFHYKGTVTPDKVGHYTQLVWADTTRVGCGLAVCYSNNTRFYVCNYGPAGNRGGYNQPYKSGTSGAECGHRDENLCDCGGKACENGGTINRTTCACTCITENRYVGDVCKLDCEDKTKADPSYCNDPTQEAYMPKSCGVYADTPDRCPTMCGKCPYGDYRYDYNGSIFESHGSTASGQKTVTSQTTVTTPTSTVTTTTPPRICKDKYMIQGGHTACLQPSDKLDKHAERNVSADAIALIVAAHNMHRATVDPPAANMLALSWDPEIAMIAQVWAETCSMTSDEQKHRSIPGRYELGQNIAVGAFNWTEAINTWSKPGENFLYGKNDESADKYTQLMWASTSRIGCGYAECEGGKFYVCNYGPSGNTLQDNTKPYVNGTRCSACPSHCTNHLCDCGTKTCENGGILDPATCTCSCKTEFYKSPSCTLSCDDVIESVVCNKTPFQFRACADNSLVQTFCPNMCKVCPYADPLYVEKGVTAPPPVATTPGHKSGHDQIGAAGRVTGGISLMIASLAVMATLSF